VLVKSGLRRFLPVLWWLLLFVLPLVVVHIQHELPVAVVAVMMVVAFAECYSIPIITIVTIVPSCAHVCFAEGMNE